MRFILDRSPRLQFRHEVSVSKSRSRSRDALWTSRSRLGLEKIWECIGLVSNRKSRSLASTSRFTSSFSTTQVHTVFVSYAIESL